MTGWLLSEISIEGFRGINNEGAPLVLKLKTDKVNTISAANAVGKSSVFDALTYALTGGIPKLDELKQAEAGHGFYLNRFHTGKRATIKLTLVPTTGAGGRTIEIVRDEHGNRVANSSDGSDADAALAELNREFVLLDADTFQNFMARAPLERGRSFAGLLGLSSYSSLRQALQALSDTRRFNNTMNDASHRQAKAAAETRVTRLRQLAGTEFQALVKEPLVAGRSQDEAEIAAHKALEQIALLKEHCTGRTFFEIDTAACSDSVKSAEAGQDRKRLEKVVETEGEWTALIDKQPIETAGKELIAACQARDDALSSTRGDLLKELYELTERVVNHDSWADKMICPACEHPGEAHVADTMKDKLAFYSAVEAATDKLKLNWASGGWNEVEALEVKVLGESETSNFNVASADLKKSGLSAEYAKTLVARLEVIKKRARSALDALGEEHKKLAAALPPSLVALTEAVAAAKRLQDTWRELREEELKLASEKSWSERTARLKGFLEASDTLFSAAESRAGARRLAAVEPVCRDMFSAVMHQPVVPSLTKRRGTEELGLALSQFFSLQNETVPARAVLSESYRNAFAASIYLAAAKLYGGAPKFIVLDDITSSFDAGHQFHLLEVIRTKFSRPAVPDGPQVILFSHDTLLEKLFNTNVQSGGWWHQRLQGTPETAVLPQNNAVDKVEERTRALLNAGQVDYAAPFIRQYLEFRLDEIVQRCRIPVPIDIAISDTKRLPADYMNAIEAAVSLNERAGVLVLDPTQRGAMTAHVASITGNYLAHWATGSTINFSAGSLLGVMRAIDDYSDCFKYADPASGQKRFYRSLSQR